MRSRPRPTEPRVRPKVAAFLQKVAASRRVITHVFIFNIGKGTAPNASGLDFAGFIVDAIGPSAPPARASCAGDANRARGLGDDRESVCRRSVGRDPRSRPIAWGRRLSHERPGWRPGFARTIVS